MDVNLDIAPITMHKTGLKKDALSGEVAVVTGGTSNIGLGIARSMAWAGAKVVIIARSADKGKAAEELINRENKPGTALFVATDVSSESSMKAMAKKAFDTFGKVDILVNNAMDMSLAAPILKSTVQQLDRQYEVAVRGALIGIQLFIPGMQQRHHGVITYLATAFAFPMGPANYCAMKSATSSMLMSLAAELGPYKDHGVSVFGIIPTSVGRPRPAPPDAMKNVAVPRSMPGYEGAIPARGLRCRNHLLHDPGGRSPWFGHYHAPGFPADELAVPQTGNSGQQDYDRVRDEVMQLFFGYMGPGFPDPKVPLISVNRSDKAPRAF